MFTHLDKARAKYAVMILVHGGGPGVEKIAAQWAERNGVHPVARKPDWDRRGRAAPFRRNDESLGLLPGGLVAFAGNGIADNPNDKAMTLGIPVQRVALRPALASAPRTALTASPGPTALYERRRSSFIERPRGHTSRNGLMTYRLYGNMAR